MSITEQPCPPVRTSLADRMVALMADLHARPGVVVAFSGGADSAFLLAAAVRALGPHRVVAATAVSASLATGEKGAAADFARSLGVAHLTPRTHELERDGYRANAGDRCYFCKAELLDVLAPIADERGWVVATGTNADDAIAGFRPGIRAAIERGAVTPLRDADLTKAQIREQSLTWALPTWDKPAAACLSSRIAYGIEISPALLARVDQAEQRVRTAVAAAGVTVTDLRVRDLGQGRARLELDPSALTAVTGPAGTGGLEAAVLAAGFEECEVRAFRSGSMNDLLSSTEQSRYR